MSTRLHTRFTTTSATTGNAGQLFRDLLLADAGGSANSLQTLNTPDANGELQMGPTPSPTAPARLWSERFAADTLISGTISFTLEQHSDNAAFTGRLRARLWKITSGGSDVETLICQVDAPAVATTTLTEYTFTCTPTPTVVAKNERLILGTTFIPEAGSFGTGHGLMGYGASESLTGGTFIDFTETFTVLPNGTNFSLSDDTTNGITGFRDLSLTTVNTAATGVVNTVASGTEIQWTKTAGGVLLAWITPRLANGWMPSAANIAGTLAAQASVSNAAANAGFRFRLFRRRPDGTEVAFYTKSGTVALTTTLSNQSVAGGTMDNVIGLFEDDRIVARCYIINIGTMGGSRTATLQYALSTYKFTILDSPSFKAAGDPSASTNVPSGLAMTGLGS